jgi:hypothetical protein
MSIFPTFLFHSREHLWHIFFKLLQFTMSNSKNICIENFMKNNNDKCLWNWNINYHNVARRTSHIIQLIFNILSCVQKYDINFYLFPVFIYNSFNSENCQHIFCIKYIIIFCMWWYIFHFGNVKKPCFNF